MIRTYDFDPLMEEIEVILIFKDTDIGVINEENAERGINIRI